MHLMSLVLGVSSVSALYAIVILFSAACTDESCRFYYISDQLAQCNDTPSYTFVPWLFAWSLMAQFYCLLYIIRSLHTLLRFPDRVQDLSLHLMVFHLIFSMACVVEFRNDEHLEQKNKFWFIRNVKEGDLHAYSAVWTFSEFSFLHAVLCYSCNSVRIFDVGTNTWYRRSDIFYAFIVALFVIFWVLQLNTTAKVFEWILLLLAAVLQLFAYNIFKSIQSVSEKRYQEIPQNTGGFLSVFNNQHALFWVALAVGISLNFLVVFIVLAPPAWDTWTISKTDPDKAPYMQVTLNFVFLTFTAAVLVVLDWLAWTTAWKQ